MKFQTRYSVETEAIAWSQLYISACVKIIVNNYSSNIHQLRDVANIVQSQAQTHAAPPRHLSTEHG